VISFMEGEVPVDAGDLLVVSAKAANGRQHLVASFHGDTNGLATRPIVSALDKVYRSSFPEGSSMICGLDANTYLKPRKPAEWLCVEEFSAACLEKGIKTCWREGQDFGECLTTYNARTYLQPQLNKGIKSVEKLAKGDCSPKDHILFYASQYSAQDTVKDNTGERRYIEGICFPTLSFPSDHGVVSTVLEQVVASA